MFCCVDRCEKARCHRTSLLPPTLEPCRYSTAVWNAVKARIGLGDIMTGDWAERNSVRDWWTELALVCSPSRKGMASLLMLISWELWKERNARIFRNVSTPSMIIVDKILEEARLWVLAGAKCLEVILPRK